MVGMVRERGFTSTAKRDAVDPARRPRLPRRRGQSFGLVQCVGRLILLVLRVRESALGTMVGQEAFGSGLVVFFPEFTCPPPTCVTFHVFHLGDS